MDTAPQKPRPTGPRTPAGKQTSSRNALSHGLTATSIDRFPADTHAVFTTHRQNLFSEYLPATENERTYFERYAFAQFLTLQSQSIEGAIIAELLTSPTSEILLNKLKTISRYTRTLERSADRARKILSELQANRLASFVLQDIITHVHNSDVTIPAAAPIEQTLQSKNYKTNYDTLALAVIYREKERQYQMTTSPSTQNATQN